MAQVGKPRPWTADDDAMLLKLVAAGADTAATARALDRTREATDARRRRLRKLTADV